jgi:hypothetical protein
MRIVATLFLSLLLLTLAADLRPPEYDEAYSIFLTAGDPRPAWPSGVFHPADVKAFYLGVPTPAKIARDLRTGDVHPPLYFWALEYWRRLTGPGWFAARMLSVLCSVAALTALAWLATLAEIPAATTILIASLSYGFAYTGIIARGFALAQLLNILGMALTLKASKTNTPAYAFAAGLSFGAAGFTNYLAIFTGAATILWNSLPSVPPSLRASCEACIRTTRSNPSSKTPPNPATTSQPPKKQTAFTTIGFALFLPPIAYFFIAQHNSRIGQFSAFSLIHASSRLAKDSGAALFGGLPLYAGRAGNFVTAALAILIAIFAGLIIKNWQRKLAPFAVATLATPAGLLALGLMFNNTPIEIRYLAFSLPFLALLLAQTLPRRWRDLLLTCEACAIAGLILAPATMQPQGIIARRIGAFAAPASLILLPFGNDGVGIPGPFIAASPPDARLQLIKPETFPTLAAEQHVILVTIPIDAASAQADTNALHNFHSNPCWFQNTATNSFRIFTQTCRGSLNSH